MLYNQKKKTRMQLNIILCICSTCIQLIKFHVEFAVLVKLAI